VLFDPWIRDTDLGWKKNPDPESKMNIPDHISEINFGVKNILINWCGSGTGIRDLFDNGSGMAKSRSGIQYKYPGSATLNLRIWY
jgi:hypothetical protein